MADDIALRALLDRIERAVDEGHRLIEDLHRHMASRSRLIAEQRAMHVCLRRTIDGSAAFRLPRPATRP